MPEPKKRNARDGRNHPSVPKVEVNRNNDNAIEPAKLQERRIAKLYAVTYATAATIARLAYAVGAP